MNKRNKKSKRITTTTLKEVIEINEMVADLERKEKMAAKIAKAIVAKCSELYDVDDKTIIDMVDNQLIDNNVHFVLTDTQLVKHPKAFWYRSLIVMAHLFNVEPYIMAEMIKQADERSSNLGANAFDALSTLVCRAQYLILSKKELN